MKTKIENKKELLKSGVYREIKSNKPRFDLLIPKNQKYENTMLFRVASLLARGAQKYEDRNWENAHTQEDLESFKQSAFRHFMQWFCEIENEEDHFAATICNLYMAEFVKEKIGDKK